MRDLKKVRPWGRLRGDPRTAAIPLIFLTGGTDPRLSAKAFQAGADLALTKPINPDRLMATLRATLALKKDKPPRGGTGPG